MGRLVFRPDGNLVAYCVKKDKKEIVVVGDQESPQYDSATNLTFSPDSKHVAYSAKRGEKWRVIIDGEVGPEYDIIVRNGPSFNSDGVLEYLGTKENTLYRVKHTPAKK